MRAMLSRFQASLAGIPPEDVALLLSAGLVIGVFPIVGCPTVLCLLAAYFLRLNPVALQLLNSISSPLQLALLWPLAQIGARVCGAPPAAGSWTGKMGALAMHAVAGWACVCVPMGAILYASLMAAVRRGGSRG